MIRLWPNIDRPPLSLTGPPASSVVFYGYSVDDFSSFRYHKGVLCWKLELKGCPNSSHLGAKRALGIHNIKTPATWNALQLRQKGVALGH